MITQQAKARILACDDSKTLRDVMAGLLSPTYEVLLCESGEEALAQVDRFRPDLVITDLQMEGLSGYEVVERIRADDRLRHVPVILLTSVTDEESRARGLESGADDYLYKPVRPRELMARVRSLLRLRRSNLALEQRSKELEEANHQLQELQATLVQAEKMASLGTLVGGVAHEINNPLAFITSGAEALPLVIDDVKAVWSGVSLEPQAEADLDAALKDLAAIRREVTEGTRRIAAIVDTLRRSAAPGSRASEPVDLAGLLAEAWRDCTAREAPPPKLELRLPERCSMRTRRDALGQVLRHVLRNAVQAAGPGGWVRASAEESPGEVALVVEDSGPGIAPHDLGRVFDPFFTTRPPGAGVGLGLTVAHGLMTSVGGRIEAASPPGMGARFTLRWPAIPPGSPGYNGLRAGAGPRRAA